VSTRVCYFDCASGASGDMLLGALVDLGLPLEALREELGKLGLQGYALEAHRVHRSGLHATKVDVVTEGPDSPGGGPEDAHLHSGTRSQEDGDVRLHAHSHEPGHPHHRGVREIADMVGRSALDAPIKARATELFWRLAEAEAAVHGTRPEDVHFHEVGALDSIVDIVGGVIGLHWLRADRFVSSPLNVGSGTVTMSHGTFPVPPPATARLVKGAPVYGAGEGELLTPTGALLVTSFASSYGPLPLLRPEAVGHGAGSRDLHGRPNVLRLIVGTEEAGAASDRVLVLETEIDDMSPQLFGPLTDRLLSAGAFDVYLTAIQMKKGRPGVLLTVITPPGRREEIEALLFAETTTLGIRRQEWERTVLARETVTVETAYGTVRVKVGRREGQVMNAQPEFADCERVSVERAVPVKEGWAAALSAWRSGPGKPR
jgi:pyridinium-3,5-bisthiocarboxylic acid mononucleotide nickel chelatase